MSPAPPAPLVGVRATQVARITHIVKEPPPDPGDDAPALTLPPLRPPLVPDDLGSFGGHRVLRLLASGGMGAVYEAVDATLGRTIALKLMLPAQAAADVGRRRFFREARAAAAIRHENVVTIYHVGEDGGIPFLTMELLRGQPLGQLLRVPMPLGELVRIGREVAAGLAAAHAIGVVHRDVKPENIWIEENGRVRLLDFGLAHLDADFPAEAPATPPPSDTADGLTQVGAIIGTPAYMAPEQARGEAVDHRADLFSLGCVLYQMLTGEFPFRGRTVREQVQALTAGAYVPIDPAPDVPPELVDLVHRLLAAPPADRPASAHAVADELLAVSTRLLVLAGGNTPLPVAELAPRTLGAPEFEFADPSPQHRPPRRSQIPLLLGTICFVVFATIQLATLRAKRAPSRPAPAADEAVSLATRPGWLPMGFQPLLNPADLSGWHLGAGGRADAWSIAGGVLVGTPKRTDQVLLSDPDYADFELRLEYRWQRRGGLTHVMLRAGEAGDGIVISIGDDEGFPARHGRPVGRLDEAGTVREVTFDPPPASRPVGDWNALRVVARGAVIDVELNGIRMPTADLALDPEFLAKNPHYARARGSVGLACHWGTIEYRHVAVKPLQ